MESIFYKFSCTWICDFLSCGVVCSNSIGCHLEALGHFIESLLAEKYPSMYTGDYVEEELEVINLKGKKRIFITCAGAAVAPFSPLPPSETCCNALKALGQPCLCVLVNGPSISGVDRNMALQLPEKCTANFEPCQVMN